VKLVWRRTESNFFGIHLVHGMTTNRSSGESRREVGLEEDGVKLFHLVPEEGSITARSSGQWFGPLGGRVEAAQNHPLIPTGHGGRRAPVTLTGLLPVDFKSVNILY